jgi:hypothetical protein
MDNCKTLSSTFDTYIVDDKKLVELEKKYIKKYDVNKYEQISMNAVKTAYSIQKEMGYNKSIFSSVIMPFEKFILYGEKNYNDISQERKEWRSMVRRLRENEKYNVQNFIISPNLISKLTDIKLKVKKEKEISKSFSVIMNVRKLYDIKKIIRKNNSIKKQINKGFTYKINNIKMEGHYKNKNSDRPYHATLNVYISTDQTKDEEYRNQVVHFSHSQGGINIMEISNDHRDEYYGNKSVTVYEKEGVNMFTTIKQLYINSLKWWSVTDAIDGRTYPASCSGLAESMLYMIGERGNIPSIYKPVSQTNISGLIQTSRIPQQPVKKPGPVRNNRRHTSNARISANPIIANKPPYCPSICNTPNPPVGCGSCIRRIGRRIGRRISNVIIPTNQFGFRGYRSKTGKRSRRRKSRKQTRKRSHKRSLRKRSRKRSLRKRSHKRSLRKRSRKRSLRKRSHKRSLRKRSRKRSLRKRSHKRSLRKRSRKRSLRKRSHKRSLRKRSRKQTRKRSMKHSLRKRLIKRSLRKRSRKQTRKRSRKQTRKRYSKRSLRKRSRKRG